jgi:hypothetical protein
MRIVIEPALEDENCTKLENGETLYVHLCSGKVIEVRPATAVRVTEQKVEALDGETVVATFPRDDVYLAVDIPMEPPSLE